MKDDVTAGRGPRAWAGGLPAEGGGDLELFEEMIRLGRAGRPSVLAVVIERTGSAPRRPGAKMLVFDDGSIRGSVGGGAVERDVIDAARAVLAEGTPRVLAFTLTKRHGHACGGRMKIYIEPNAVVPRLVMVGAGHVGAAVVPLAVYAGFRVAVIDTRPAFARAERLPGADPVLCATAAEGLERMAVGPATAVVIVTHAYANDVEAVCAALRTRAGYIGVIGSARKRAALEKTLTKEGFPEAERRRVIMPLGLPIGAETPREIAVSIVAQLIDLRRTHGAFTLGGVAGGGCIPPDGNA